jgi:hypothetical protein
MLNDKQKTLLKEVIEAARDGRYCHGNGAIWVIVEKGNPKQVIWIDHVRMTRKKSTPAESENYLKSTRAHKSDDTVRSLENFIRTN